MVVVQVGTGIDFPLGLEHSPIVDGDNDGDVAADDDDDDDDGPDIKMYFSSCQNRCGSALFSAGSAVLFCFFCLYIAVLLFLAALAAHVIYYADHRISCSHFSTSHIFIHQPE